MARQKLVNLLTIAVTVLILAGVGYVSLRSGDSHSPKPITIPTGQVSVLLISGVVTDPTHAVEWEKALGWNLDIAASFLAWSSDRDVTRTFKEDARQGLAPMITWEPWQPPKLGTPAREQGAVQPKYSNEAIAAGRLDGYIRRFARTCAAYGGSIFLRYAHEMNGYWYPWSHDPKAYIKAWRHVYEVFQQEGATNVEWLWGVGSRLNTTSGSDWWQNTIRYWPGSRYVDWVGATMIDFGRLHEHPVSQFIDRIGRMRALAKPLMLDEVNVNFEQRIPWLTDLRKQLAEAPWIRGLVWSQAPSRGQQSQRSPGNMDWSTLDDPASARILGQIFREGHQLGS